MKKFQDFEIEVNKENQADLIGRIKDNGAWKRDIAEEKKFRDPSDYFIFAKENNIGCDPCTLFLFKRDTNLRVGNIIAKNKSRLTHDEYNACLNSFVNFISPQIGGYKTNITSSNFSLSDYLSNEGIAALEFFSHTANKSTGSAHPSDKERWQMFIIRAHLEGNKLPIDYLERWLIEKEGWHPDVASDLAIEYEQAQSLLSVYDNYK